MSPRTAHDLSFYKLATFISVNDYLLLMPSLSLGGLIEEEEEEEISTFLQKEAIVRVNSSEQLTGFGFYSKYFIIPKKDGGLCPILGLRWLNTFVKLLPFKMLNTKQILGSIGRREWFTFLDLKDTYFHVPICPDHRPFLQFVFHRQAYQLKVLPSGLSLSPRVNF